MRQLARLALTALSLSNCRLGNLKVGTTVRLFDRIFAYRLHDHIDIGLMSFSQKEFGKCVVARRCGSSHISDQYFVFLYLILAPPNAREKKKDLYGTRQEQELEQVHIHSCPAGGLSRSTRRVSSDRKRNPYQRRAESKRAGRDGLSLENSWKQDWSFGS